jgi:MoaA/NifB/PqqE/SkfB family radical SAM enzyme
MPIPVDDGLLKPGPIRKVRLDLTQRCNLRCVYCAVSSPTYHGADMSNMTARKVVALILQLARYNPLEAIDLNGHGETTFRQGWTDICFALVEQGIPVRLTSNFAKAFDEDELEALACMDTIAVSIDTADRMLLQRLRRRVDLRQITTNMTLIKAAALKLHRTPPRFGFLCGLYDKNSLEWDAFARFSIASDIIHMGIWTLTPHPGLNVPDEDRVRPLDDLSDSDLRPRIVSVLRGLRLLRRHGVAVTVQGDFVGALARRVGLDATADS